MQVRNNVAHQIKVAGPGLDCAIDGLIRLAVFVGAGRATRDYIHRRISEIEMLPVMPSKSDAQFSIEEMFHLPPQVVPILELRLRNLVQVALEHAVFCAHPVMMTPENSIEIHLEVCQIMKKNLPSKASAGDYLQFIIAKWSYHFQPFHKFPKLRDIAEQALRYYQDLLSQIAQ